MPGEVLTRRFVFRLPEPFHRHILHDGVKRLLLRLVQLDCVLVDDELHVLQERRIIDAPVLTLIHCALDKGVDVLCNGLRRRRILLQLRQESLCFLLAVTRHAILVERINGRSDDGFDERRSHVIGQRRKQLHSFEEVFLRRCCFCLLYLLFKLPLLPVKCHHLQQFGLVLLNDIRQGPYSLRKPL